MRHGPANALDPALVASLAASLDADEAERSGRPLVLTGNGRFFSAGLDLAGLPREREEMGGFVDAFDDLMRRLFLFPCPTVAAVNGHAVAGGAILAAACDVRIGAVGSYRVGVSEVQLGVIFPATAFEVLRAAIPAARTAEVLLRGRLTGRADLADAVTNGFLHELGGFRGGPPGAGGGGRRHPGGSGPRRYSSGWAREVLPRSPAPRRTGSCLAGAHARRWCGAGRSGMGRGTRGRVRAVRQTKRELRAEFADRAALERAPKRERFLDTWFSEESKARRAAILKKGPKQKRG